MLLNDSYYQILSQRNKTIFTKIDLLNWSEEKIGEIGGLVSSGSVSIQNNSSTRRTCSLSFEVVDDSFDINSVDNNISINKKISIKIGVSNSVKELEKFGEIVWFPLGIFVLTSASISRDSNGIKVSLSASDKMCLLDGSIAGVVEGFLEVHQVAKEDESLEKLTIEEIIYYVVAGLGGEDRSKIIIKDVPKYNQVPMIYEGKTPLYFDEYGNQVESSKAYRTVSPGEYSGYILEPFYYPGELNKSPGESLASILDSIKNVLGNYEYFYDLDGNFVFQEIQNFLNTSFTSLTKLNTGDYVANFNKTPYVFSFKGKDIVSAYTNNPNWSNIKNEFIVWGTAEETPIMYHLVIDNKPNIAEEGYPWQQYLIDYGDQNPLDPGKYYGELSSKFPQIYDKENRKWKSDPNDFKYYFDMIDTDAQYGKFSVSSIGKRVKAITDDKVGRLYPPRVPEYFILNAGDDAEKNKEVIDELNKQGQKFLILKESDYNLHTEAPYSKDAFSVIRENLYYHTTMNESITLTSLPLYFLDVNQRIEVYDTKSGIQGDYMISGISLSFDPGALMSITGIKANSRI